MADVYNPEKTYTLDDFVSQGVSDEITYNTYAIKGIIDGNRITTTNVFNYYLDELKAICLKIPTENITVEQKAKYKYCPDLLAYDIYGSTQFDFVVMLCNGIIDPKDFDFKTPYILLPTQSVMKQFLSAVVNSEQEWINAKPVK